MTSMTENQRWETFPIVAKKWGKGKFEWVKITAVTRPKKVVR